jgi:gamma-glutamylcyclotransferase (GGCT)/AIG2-like uncharacterized protein YtfP
VEKARWLSDLFNQLFVEKTFKAIRQKVDFDEMEDVKELIISELAWHHLNAPVKFAPEQKELLDAFTDYLNFFEFVGLLRKMGRLNDADIESLFDYYLRRIVEIDTDQLIRRYLSALGFENLTHLLNRSAQYLFVYGTFKTDGSRHKLISALGLKFVAKTNVPGRLYSLESQDYPAGMLARRPGSIQGELYRLPVNDKREVLNEIDREEGVDEGLFARVLVQLELGSQTIRAWAYTYLKVVDDDMEIKSGSFGSQ